MTQEAKQNDVLIKKVRKTFIDRSPVEFLTTDFNSPIFSEEERETPDFVFANEFTKIGGKFVYCSNNKDLAEKLKSLIESENWKDIFCVEPDLLQILNDNGVACTHEVDNQFHSVGITHCECLVAKTGSIIVSSGMKSGRTIDFSPDYHIVVTQTSDLFFQLQDALQFIKDKYESRLPGMITCISGPSSTLDTDKNLVYGSKGPKEIYCFLVDNSL